MHLATTDMQLVNLPYNFTTMHAPSDVTQPLPSTSPHVSAMHCLATPCYSHHTTPRWLRPSMRT
jgi:hypothetical protein